MIEWEERTSSTNAYVWLPIFDVEWVKEWARFNAHLLRANPWRTTIWLTK